MPAPPATAPLTWSLVVPVKVLARAKTRLASLAGADRPALALAMAADTVAAALDCPQVGRVIVVTDDPQAAEVLADLGDALRVAARWPQAFVPDSAGSGTTLYAVRPGTAFRPRFGPGSAARHRAAGAAEITRPGLASLRRDVDEPADLSGARELGLGTRTAALAARLNPGQTGGRHE